MKPEIDPKTMKKIEKRVKKILENNPLSELNEKQVREKASEKLDLDLNKPPYLTFVRRVVENFLQEFKSNPEYRLALEQRRIERANAFKNAQEEAEQQ